MLVRLETHVESGDTVTKNPGTTLVNAHHVVTIQEVAAGYVRLTAADGSCLLVSGTVAEVATQFGLHVAT